MKKKTYTPAPEVPEEIAPRYKVMLAVLSGAMTVSEGARQLGLSRNHFQTVLHRGLSGLIEGMLPKTPGRAGRTQEETALLEENARLRRDNDRLQQRVDTIDRLLGVASGMLRGRIEPRSRTPTAKTETPAASGEGKSDEPEEPDGGRIDLSEGGGYMTPRIDMDPEVRRRLAGEGQLRNLGLSAPLAAAVVGSSCVTLRRWRQRIRRGESPQRRRGPQGGPEVSPELRAKVEELVRQLHGLVGAESLRRSVPGVSRRQAGCIKRQELTRMERERIGQSRRVVVSEAGVIRGFDQLHVRTTGGVRYLLLAGDAKVALRTSCFVVEHYSGDAVYQAIERDIDRHGAPLAWRMDRFSAHRVQKVGDLLSSHGVLLLHGPPYYPRYYGQLERQNREHRAWLSALGPLSPEALDTAAEEMLRVLNGRWRRRTLEWKTSEEVWQRRPRLEVDRAALREEVREKADRIRRQLSVRGNNAADLAERLGIEQVLIKHGFLSLEARDWC